MSFGKTEILEITEARTGRLRRELELSRSHPKDVVGALDPVQYGGGHNHRVDGSGEGASGNPRSPQGSHSGSHFGYHWRVILGTILGCLGDRIGADLN